ncbi:MAG: hypothetical protein OXI72_06845 [Gemmatimonadota bacterium]|nr:hypothetical protein [Gemmatimonadota bacterium]
MNEIKNNNLVTFEGVNAKVARADNGLTSLKDEMNRFCKELWRSVNREIREDTDEQIWIYRGETPKVPLGWSVRIGEILYNLRSALDHLVWQLVLINGQTPGQYNSFPIVSDKSKWDKEKSRKLKGISQKDEEMIRRLQPYTGGINLPFDVSAFWALHTLCNIDKYRHLILAAISLDMSNPIFGHDFSPVQGLKGQVYSGKIVKGKVLSCFNNAETEINPSFQIGVSFEKFENIELKKEDRLAEIFSRSLFVRPASTVLCKCLKAVQGALSIFKATLIKGHTLNY